jgi:hypothetical protein
VANPIRGTHRRPTQKPWRTTKTWHSVLVLPNSLSVWSLMLLRVTGSLKKLPQDRTVDMAIVRFVVWRGMTASRHRRCETDGHSPVGPSWKLAFSQATLKRDANSRARAGCRPADGAGTRDGDAMVCRADARIPVRAAQGRPPTAVHPGTTWAWAAQHLIDTNEDGWPQGRRHRERHVSLPRMSGRVKCLAREVVR